jgi:ABC-type lipoprotein release transport system permease subunit
MLETMLMSMIGLWVGVALGAAVAFYFNQVGFYYPGMEEMADKFNLSARMYPSVTFASMMLGPAVVFAFSMAAALYPSFRLFRLQPVAAMRTV